MLFDSTPAPGATQPSRSTHPPGPSPTTPSAPASTSAPQPSASRVPVGAARPQPRFAHFGPFALDLERRELSRAGVKIKLQSKVCDALLVLLEAPGEIVTREALRMRLWPADSQVNYDANVNTTVNKLRQALGDSPDAPQFVETIPRQGYSFTARVEYIDAPADAVSRSAPSRGLIRGLWNQRTSKISPGTGPGNAAGTAHGSWPGPGDVGEGRRTNGHAAGFLSQVHAMLSERPSRWFVAGVIALILASALFGAAVTLFQRASSKHLSESQPRVERSAS